LADREIIRLDARIKGRIAVDLPLDLGSPLLTHEGELVGLGIASPPNA
jgi:hypothetical protein